MSYFEGLQPQNPKCSYYVLISNETVVPVNGKN